MDLIYNLCIIGVLGLVGLGLGFWGGWLSTAATSAPRAVDEICVVLDDDSPTQRSARPAELARAIEQDRAASAERYRRWIESLPEEVACETPADGPTVAIDIASIRAGKTGLS